MLKSMTGFGKSSIDFSEKKISVEMRSLNSKQLDLSVRMPGRYKAKETELRSELGKILDRGKVDVVIYTEEEEREKKFSVNKVLAKQYFDELKALETELDQTPQNYLSVILKMPDVLQVENSEPDESEWSSVMIAVKAAAEKLNEFRGDEGKVLAQELGKRIENILKGLKDVEEADPLRIKKIRDRIQKNISEVVVVDKIDHNRFEQEMIYYVEKIDITEEKVRLKTHCNYFTTTMQEPSCGRKLGFISQEIGREINTIGSKANDVSIQKIIVQMKDELEKIKEQSLNVL
ncbi:MAG: YicC/YloC family endoribonuclease [Bacteroidia bacterium]